MESWAVQAMVTAVMIPILGWYLTRLIKQRDESEIAERKAWQRGAIERHATLVKRLENVEKCMREMKLCVNGKLSIDDFERESSEKWARINHHEHVIDCEGDGCTARRTAGVII